MFKFKMIYNKDGEITEIETPLTGNDLLCVAKLNKGAAFSQEERERFGLTGLLPIQVETLEQQAERMYAQFKEHHTNLGKNIYLNVLHDYNETLFYKTISDHLEEMLPIVYTPTVGEAVQRFSLEMRKARGVYVSYPDRDKIDEILDNRLPPEVDLCVTTDGGAVLGIGDQGIGGINISIAKLMVYTLCGGINPHRVLPVQLDVGTNNQQLLNDPMYLGWRHERITGQEYDDFVDMYVTAIKKKFPNIMLHWEDVGRDHARKVLDRYRNKLCSLNGDIQTTAVVALAGVLSGADASSTPLDEHRIVILGAGTAGVGIADLIHSAFVRNGMDEKDAYDKFWLVDKDGLIIDNQELPAFQKPYARADSEIKQWTLRDSDKISFYDVIENVKPTILIGCSTATGAFNEEIVKCMASHVERPIIMPLSNPNSLSEAEPENVMQWTNGKAIIATGSPYPDYVFDGKHQRVAQCNNALAYPGIGLGTIAAQAKYISDDMLWAATQALSEYSPIHQDKMAPLLPKLSEARIVSMHVAEAVAEQARAEGLAQIGKDVDLKEHINKIVWVPKYYPYTKI